MENFKCQASFDTFDNKYATDFSLTLRLKHKNYQYSRLSRTYLCGVDDNLYSTTAIKWLFEDLAEDGDKIICLRVIDPSHKLTNSDSALEEKKYRDEASCFMERILQCNTRDCGVSFILEFAVGKVQNMIQRMIQIYEPAILVVGTKGRSLDGFKGLLPGSVSKYCLQHSPVPVVVVRPSQKREKKKLKRENDPNRRTYKEMLINIYKENGPDDIKVYKRGAIGNERFPDLPIYLTTPDNTTSTKKEKHGLTLTTYDTDSTFRSRSSDVRRVRSPSPLLKSINFNYSFRSSADSELENRGRKRH